SHPRALWINTGLFLFFQLFGLFHPLAELTFINVGQGDAILIRSPFRTGDILVDTGKPSQWNALNSFLEAKGISSLDTLIITHADKDHSGNLDAVKQEYRPRQVITEHQREIHSGIIVMHDLNEIRNDDENESSIVLYFLMNGKRILLMGDSTVHTEETIVHSDINLSADLLKLSHHGSHTGSCDLFLDTVQPGLAIVSSGAYEIYHHPSPETVEKLNARRIPYLDTKEEGDISVFFLPAGISFLLTSRLNFQLTGL
ncbi:MAG: MBL fold metallo-hydrolase, partial [Solobacterium sp.]|nr:MBL fold metallo-hydrolase [Solobacterium sp.]